MYHTKLYEHEKNNPLLKVYIVLHLLSRDFFVNKIKDRLQPFSEEDAIGDEDEHKNEIQQPSSQSQSQDQSQSQLQHQVQSQQQQSDQYINPSDWSQRTI